MWLARVQQRAEYGRRHPLRSASIRELVAAKRDEGLGIEDIAVHLRISTQAVAAYLANTGRAA